eukprot:3350236-Prymnesium_polylepis.1
MAPVCDFAMDFHFVRYSYRGPCPPHVSSSLPPVVRTTVPPASHAPLCNGMWSGASIGCGM